MPPSAERTPTALKLSGAERTGLDLPLVPVRHPSRWFGRAIAAVLAAMLVASLLRNPHWQWDYVRGYLMFPAILQGVVVTLRLTVLSMLFGIGLGVLLAIARMSTDPVLSRASWLFVWVVRGTPLLVQLLFWYSFSYLFDDLSIGIPFGPTFHTWDTNSVLTPFITGVLGLGLNEAAYMAEIVRAGLLSVDRTQHDAAAALGMGPFLAMRRVVLPQAMRVIVPPLGNEIAGMLKTTSLVAAIGVQELTGSAQLIYGSNNLQIPLLLVACCWYLLMTSVLAVVQQVLERRLSRGSQAAGGGRDRRRRMLGRKARYGPPVRSPEPDNDAPALDRWKSDLTTGR